MTISSTAILPLHPESIIRDLKDVQNYLSELTVALQDMYEEIAYGINGEIRSDTFTQRNQWLPVLKGTTNDGSFTYTRQTGWAFRQGIFVDAWFDVAWSAIGGATGNLYVELPYNVAVSNDIPFVGVCQPSALTFTGGNGLVINAITNTFRGEFWNVGNGFTTARQAVVGSGRIIGHIRYMGQANEE